jgi:polyisoprenyl-teichoic acid--peptidoglycan teichoic acid transferase
MARPRRRLAIGVLIVVGIMVGTTTLWLGLKWKRALDNVEAMRVASVTLPTLAPGHAAPDAELPTAAAPNTFAETPAPTEPTAGPTPIPGPDAPINILLMGTDARIGEDISRTDAMILVHLDGRSNRVSMLSFPRDLWVSLPGYGKNKINAAYPTGEKLIGTGYGPALAKETVGNLTGLPVQRFVLINFDGFKTLIDKLGGIYIDVPKAIDDPKYPTDDFRTIKVHFDAGRQLMDGDTALIYSRTRHADSDFGRNQRQQQVLMAIFDRIREQGLLTQLTSLDTYTEVLRDYVRTDLSRGEMLQLASVGPRLRADDIKRYAISPKMVAEELRPSYRLLLTDPKGLKQLVRTMLGDTVASAGGDDSRP